MTIKRRFKRLWRSGLRSLKDADRSLKDLTSVTQLGRIKKRASSPFFYASSRRRDRGLYARLHSLLSGLAHDHVGQVRALGLGVAQVNLIVHLSLEE